MIVHIVMFKFKEKNKEKNILKVKELLEELPNKINELDLLDVGISFDKSLRAMDLSLYTIFNSKQDFENYVKHPEHLKVVNIIKEVTEFSKVVDYIK